MIPVCLKSGLARIASALILTCISLAGLVSAQPAAPDGEDIRGAKPLVEIPVPPKPPVALWSGIAGAVVLAAIAWFIWRKLRARKRRTSLPEVALAELSQLESTRDELAAEAFADRAAGTVRNYIAGRFGIVAPRRTTEEFLRDLAGDANSPLAGESDHLREFLKSCDLAKFAGSQLDAGQRTELLQSARRFVTATAAPQPASPPALPS